MLGALSAVSSVLGESGVLGSDAKADTATTGPVSQDLKSGDIVFQSTDSWIWVVVLAVLAVIVLRK